MRKFSGITNINSPEAAIRDKLQIVQTDMTGALEKDDPGRTGMNIQPYRTEFRNIFK
jgi:hypothetical protein